jgi:hypothetical protein
MLDAIPQDKTPLVQTPMTDRSYSISWSDMMIGFLPYFLRQMIDSVIIRRAGTLAFDASSFEH